MIPRLKQATPILPYEVYYKHDPHGQRQQVQAQTQEQEPKPPSKSKITTP